MRCRERGAARWRRQAPPLLWREASMEIFVLVRNESGVSRKRPHNPKYSLRAKHFTSAKGCVTVSKRLSNRHLTELVVLGQGPGPHSEWSGLGPTFLHD